MSDYVCKDLIVKIFARLPVKSLLRFRSLSKSISSIISSPSFVRMHTFPSSKKLLIRHQNLYKNEEDFYTLHGEDELPLCLERGYIGITPVQFPFGREFLIVGSYNGILCLIDDLEENRISVWNPSIRCKLTLPDCPQSCFSQFGTGFGYDSITHDYKIVSIYNQSSFVYTMKTGAWCAIASPTPSFHEVLSNACFVNGALHLVVEVEPCFIDDIVGRRYVLTFDLSTHVFGRIVLPKSTWETRQVQLTTMQGSLAVISFSVDYHGGYGDIWVRKDGSWSLVFELKSNQVEGGLYRVLQLTSNGDLLFNTTYNGFHVYNPERGAQSAVLDFNDDSSLDDIVPCVESLQLLDVWSACQIKEK